MKKSLIILIALVLLFVGGGYYAQTTIVKEKDQVFFAEKIHYGDKSKLADIEVIMRNQYNGYLFWDSTVDIQTVTTETKQQFYPMWYDENYVYENYAFQFWKDTEISLNIDEKWYLGEKEGEGLEKAYLELYESMSPGELKEKEIYLKDYVEYYPFQFQMTLSDSWMLSLNREMLEADVNTSNSPAYVEEAKQQLEWQKELQEYFKIPVLEEEKNLIALNLDEEGYVIGWSHGSTSSGSSSGTIDHIDSPLTGDSFEPWIISAVAEGKAFFTFDTRTYNNNVVDTSLIPDGYGIYMLPFDEEKEEIYPEKLDVVYELDPNVQVCSLFLDAQQENLVLTVFEDEQLVLSVIDIATMEEKQKITIEGSAEFGMSSCIYEDYLILESTELYVYERNNDGTFTEALKVNLEKANEVFYEYFPVDYLTAADTQYAWNGEQLILSNSICKEDEYIGFYDSCDFYIAAFDEEGLFYLGEYNSTLETGYSDDWSQKCSPVRHDKIKIVWK